MKFLPDRSNILVESEQGQALFRLYAAIAALLVYGTIAILSSAVAQRYVALASVAVYMLYAYAWLWVVSLDAGPRATRQWAAVVLDQLVFAACFGFGGPAVAALAWVPVTTSVGHGLRFGERRGTVAAIAGSLGIFDAVMLGPSWHVPLSIAFGMAASALIVPLYVVRLVRTMSTQRRDAEKRAQALANAVRIDSLTGVLSRAGFQETMRGLQQLAQTSGEHIGLVFLDLDGFKAINDAKGHDVGDLVLREVANTLVDVVRASDSVARFGGDEFVIVVKAAASEEAVACVAEKAVEAIRGLTYAAASGMSVGASAGVAILGPGGSLNDALIAADTRMFEVKRTRKQRGRNQFYMAPNA